MSTRERVELVVRGRVQGVYFRASTRDAARRLGLVGWVRNEPDGSVRVLAEGPRAALEALERWCHRGPPSAHVDAVVVHWSAAEGTLRDFAVTR
jgi:acylphosphatase